MASNSLTLTSQAAADASKSSYDAALAAAGITRTGAQANTAAKGNKTTLGQEDFIALMTAQLKNQDPFKPVENTEMVAQMAQFSSSHHGRLLIPSGCGVCSNTKSALGMRACPDSSASDEIAPFFGRLMGAC